ncbi:Putative protein kinase [Colletotrichum destructivum]|uniref:Protein kinase domain-containing protein n=1 Tax=Colletotrichum destructivum TaxID=34406 RepID=A0AAX4I5Y7_9PEZI|nr:Putative protein kinase [Colletotrichum destructivum]
MTMQGRNRSANKSASEDWAGEVQSLVEKYENKDRNGADNPAISAIHGQSGVSRRRTRENIDLSENSPRPNLQFAKSDQGSIGQDISRIRTQKSLESISTCVDHGDSYRLSNRDTTPPSADQSGSLPQLREEVLHAVGQHDHLEPRHPGTRLELQKELFNALERQSNDKEFLPLQALDDFITENTVQRELEAEFDHLSKSEIEACVHYVCTRKKISDPRTKHLKFTSGQRIFALLIMIEGLDSFLNLMSQGLHDIDLPLKDNCQRSSHRPKTFTCFQSWSPFRLRSFDEWQWKLLAPYFSTTKDREERVLFYSLPAPTVMPWLSETGPRSADPEPDRFGGYSTVKKVKIHPSHHNFQFPEGREPCFAVKKLYTRNKKEFDREVDALKRFNTRTNSNLVQLLATYRHHNNYCLLFPGADGNLKDLWEANPQPVAEPSYKRAMWMAEVCHGIATGLSQIHQHRTTEEIRRDAIEIAKEDKKGDSPAGILSNTPANLRQNDDRFGRHGDIKPENILWFKNYKADSYLGVLQISDFGLTRFHSKHSISKHMSEAVGGRTYRAPEFDTTRNGFDQSYDIWTLGCVYLEFITWYLLGWDQVDDFSQKRTEEDDEALKSFNKDGFPEDKFYKLDGDGSRATVKSSVTRWFKVLHSRPDCTDYIHQFLYFVEGRMLRVMKTERAECGEVAGELCKLLEQCDKRPEFCLHGIPEI